MNYRYYHSSQIGSAHIKSNTPKQDDLGVFDCVINDKNYLISVLADGAGSAKYSEISSKHICRFLIKKTAAFLNENTIEDLNKDVAILWIKQFQVILNRFIKIYKLSSIREFATTVLFALLSDDKSVFFQIGDGAIIIGNNEKLDCVFKPQKGEYINTTHFIVESNFEENMEFKVIDSDFENLAMHTDGIEMISLKNLETPSLGFFNPFFDCLKEELPGYNEELSQELAEFLSCDRVNQRTNDDKTMLIVQKVK